MTKIESKSALAEIERSPIRVAPETDIWRGYNAEKATRGLSELAGAWADAEGKKLAAEMRKWRRLGSRK
jgi:hypothetical protein